MLANWTSRSTDPRRKILTRMEIPSRESKNRPRASRCTRTGFRPNMREIEIPILNYYSQSQHSICRKEPVVYRSPAGTMKFSGITNLSPLRLSSSLRTKFHSNCIW